MKEEYVIIDDEDWAEYEDKTRRLIPKINFWVNLIAAGAVIVIVTFGVLAYMGKINIGQ